MTDKDHPDETDGDARAEPRAVTGPPTQGGPAPRPAPPHVEPDGGTAADPAEDASRPSEEWETPQAIKAVSSEAPGRTGEPPVPQTDWLVARMEAAAAHYAESQPVSLEAGPEGLIAAMPLDEATFEPTYSDTTSLRDQSVVPSDMEVLPSTGSAPPTANAGPLEVLSTPNAPRALFPEAEPANREADLGAFPAGHAAPEAAAAPPAQAETFAEQEHRRDRALRLLKVGARYAAYAVAGYLALVVVLIGLYRFVDPPGSTLMLFRWIGGDQIEQTWVPIERISPQLVRAVVVAEDGRFCDHWGIDVEAMQEAIERAAGGVARGASTISMQVVKNMFLWPSKSYVRKIIELPLTVIMELLWPKRRILEVYLNVAEWGPGIFGAEAAARHHFNKSSARLSEHEAALLAASLPNPVRRDAGDPGPRTARKARVIEARMQAAGPVAACVLHRN